MPPEQERARGYHPVFLSFLGLDELPDFFSRARLFLRADIKSITGARCGACCVFGAGLPLRLLSISCSTRFEYSSWNCSGRNGFTRDLANCAARSISCFFRFFVVVLP